MRGIILALWTLLDPIYFRCTRLIYLPIKDEAKSVLRIRLTKYKGKIITLSDGTEIKKNDILVKIHLHNIRIINELRDIKSEFKKGIIVFRYVQKSLPDLFIYIQEHHHSQKIKGIIGVTLLNKGADRLGFDHIIISSKTYRCYKWLSFLPIGWLASSNPSVRDIVQNHQPCYLIMSTNTLSKRLEA